MGPNAQFIERAATVHDRAAEVHSLVAKFWDDRGRKGRAKSERVAAAAQHDRAERLRGLNRRSG